MQKRPRLLTEIALHGHDVVFQPGAEGHQAIREQVPDLREEHVPGLGVLPLVILGLDIKSREPVQGAQARMLPPGRVERCQVPQGESGVLGRTAFEHAERLCRREVFE